MQFCKFWFCLFSIYSFFLKPHIWRLEESEQDDGLSTWCHLTAQFSFIPYCCSALGIHPIASLFLDLLKLDDVIDPRCSNCHLMANTSLICTHSPDTSPIWTLSYFPLKEAKSAVKMSLGRFMRQRFEQHQLSVIILICLFGALVNLINIAVRVLFLLNQGLNKWDNCHMKAMWFNQADPQDICSRRLQVCHT